MAGSPALSMKTTTVFPLTFRMMNRSQAGDDRTD
jgi:hypothetical protein